MLQNEVISSNSLFHEVTNEKYDDKQKFWTL